VVNVWPDALSLLAGGRCADPALSCSGTSAAGPGHYTRLQLQPPSRTLPAAAWNGSWNGAPDNPSAASAVNAMTRAIGAASAHSARDRTYGK